MSLKGNIDIWIMIGQLGHLQQMTSQEALLEIAKGQFEYMSNDTSDKHASP